ncbi:MAG TPA: MerR family transcriptional regulator [Ktedonobacterales bacterium]
MVRQETDIKTEGAAEGRSARAKRQAARPGLPATSSAVLRIDDVSKLTGLSKRTLRYYEELGLLERAQRSDGNYRMYRVEDVTALQRIKEMRDLLGLGLSEIRDMVGYELEREQARARWRHDESPGSRLEAIAEAERATTEQLQLIESRIQALTTMGQSLRERLALYQQARATVLAQAAEIASPTSEEPR